MKYAIKRTRSFYGPSYKKDLVIADGLYAQQAATFETKSEADAHIAELNNAIYHTSHSESGRAEYNAVLIQSLPQYLKAYL